MSDVPRLENGDRLNRLEFERRYSAWPDVKKAELVEGVVYLPSPVRMKEHAKPHGQIVTWLGTYAARTPGVEMGDNGTLRLDLDNEPQPDAVLRVLEDHGGRSRVDEDRFLTGAPELVVEVSASSVSYDLGPKKTAFRRNGIQEYLVFRVGDREVDWFALRGGEYERIGSKSELIVNSAVFPGLWLDVAALVDGRLDRVLDVLHQGLCSGEHQEFVNHLGAQRAASV